MTLLGACLGSQAGLTFFSVFRGGGVTSGTYAGLAMELSVCSLILSAGCEDWIAFALS